MRAFIAVNLDRQIRDELVRLQQRLAKKVKGFRWTKGELLHITLRFLGEIEPLALSSIAGALEKVGQNTPSFSLSFSGLCAFPAVSKLRVIWIGLGEGETELAGLARDVCTALQETASSFVPHLTIARSKKNEIVNASRDVLDGDWRCAGTFRVESFSLMESILYPSGPVYKELKKFFLNN
ncbi:MAG: RNA 2',3'-cyclic phosphodiesterase [Bacillota bacterium]